jgi:hypothetical protein
MAKKMGLRFKYLKFVTKEEKGEKRKRGKEDGKTKTIYVAYACDVNF